MTAMSPNEGIGLGLILFGIGCAFLAALILYSILVGGETVRGAQAQLDPRPGEYVDRRGHYHDGHTAVWRDGP